MRTASQITSTIGKTRPRLMLPLNVLAKIENYNRFRHLFEGLTHNKIYVRQERSEYL